MVLNGEEYGMGLDGVGCEMGWGGVGLEWGGIGGDGRCGRDLNRKDRLAPHGPHGAHLVPGTVMAMQEESILGQGVIVSCAVVEDPIKERHRR